MKIATAHLVSKATHRWLILYLDLKSGRELWRQEAYRGTPPSPLHVKNPYASETPVTDGERVYACFGNVGVFCYAFDGRKLWSTNWPPATRLEQATRPSIETATVPAHMIEIMSLAVCQSPATYPRAIKSGP